MTELTLGDILNEPAWLTAARRGDLGLGNAELDALAWEDDERGCTAGVAGLLNALELRHAKDRVTLAVLKALRLNHLPTLVRNGGQVWSI